MKMKMKWRGANKRSRKSSISEKESVSTNTAKCSRSPQFATNEKGWHREALDRRTKRMEPATKHSFPSGAPVAQNSG